MQPADEGSEEDEDADEDADEDPEGDDADDAMNDVPPELERDADLTRYGRRRKLTEKLRESTVAFMSTVGVHTPLDRS